MLYKDSVVIDATSDKVWEYVGEPDLWGLFHAKLDSCEKISGQSGRIGSEYAMVFRLGAKRLPTRCKIVDLRPAAMIQVLSTASDSNRPPISAMLNYSLHDLGAKTRVDERIEVLAPKINLLIRAVVWLISRFGWSAGDTTLMRLKKIVEEDSRLL